MTHTPSDITDLEISAINSNDKLSWKANTCMLSKGHAEYGGHCDSSEGSLNLAQIDSQLYTDLHAESSVEAMTAEDALAMVQSWSNKYQTND